MTRHTIIPTRSFLKVLATRSGDTTIKSIKAPGNSNQSGKCFGIKSLKTTATKAIHFPISPLRT
uniref:Uncharacterized protein n=1 Tax=Medicago truncatula TaxID=3880 RepID=I3SGB0_MEDTR|nr:unknown [Medicago truncatula]